MQEIKSNHWVTHDKGKEKHNIIMLFISLLCCMLACLFLSFSFNFSREIFFLSFLHLGEKVLCSKENKIGL